MQEGTNSSSGESTPVAARKTKRGAAFWTIFITINFCLFISALELSAVSTALPTIVADLHGEDFIWVGTAYALASTAFLPFSGGVAQIFGRRPAMLLILAVFATGSAISGAAKSMTMLIAGRTVQGIGGGGIQALTAIILADMVTLRERGVYAASFGMTSSIASFAGPVIGGSLASQGQWRWIFYLNLPIIGFVATLLVIFLRVPTPPGTIASKLKKMDWLGNILVIGGTTSFMIAMTWGGATAPWSSAKVLVPLCLGVFGLIAFFAYESIVPKFPMVPFSILSNRTSLSGYLQTFFSGFIAIALVYWLPVYFQACQQASPIRSGVLLLGFATLAPAALIAGIVVKKSGKYLIPMWFGWVVAIIGLGLLTTIKFDSSQAKVIGLTVLIGVGIGFEYSTTVFPIQAPLSVTQNAHALSFLQFCRAFSSIWGVTIGLSVLQNQLEHVLPPSFLSQLPGGVSIAYSVIPEIPSLPTPLNTQVKRAFADSLRTLWEVLVGICGLGLLSALLMKDVPLANVLDEDWTMHTPKKDDDMLDKSQPAK